MPNDSLTIVCEVDILYSSTILSKESIHVGRISVTENTPLSTYGESAFLDQDLADFKIICQERIFNCHSITLARSPVFKTMLTTSMEEAISREVTIEKQEVHNLMCKLYIM